MKRLFHILVVAIILSPSTMCQAQNNSRGLYYEITGNTHTAQMDVNNYSKVYVAPSGDMRQETQATIPLMGEIYSVTLSTKNDPSHQTIINEKTKVYAITDALVHQDDESGLTEKAIINNDGKETVNGFPCTKLSIIDQGDTTKIWLSDAVPGNKESINVLSKIMGLDSNSHLIRLIHQEGYKGNWIKFVSPNSNNSPDAVQVSMEVTKANYADVLESIMKVPAGYTETKGDPFAVHVHNETKEEEHFKTNVKIGKQ